MKKKEEVDFAYKVFFFLEIFNYNAKFQNKKKINLNAYKILIAAISD